jgi:putative flippase GtrA
MKMDDIDRAEEKFGHRTIVRRVHARGILLFFESIKAAPSTDISVQVIRSLIVSIVALVFDFGMLIILKEIFGLHYLLAAALSFCLGVAVNYYLSVKWVFANRKFSNKHAEFTIFFAICAVGLALNLGIIAGMVQLAGSDYKVAKGVSTVIVFFWNFIARKKILY